MHAPPPDLDPSELARFIASRWGGGRPSLRYAPLGFGAHHWYAVASGTEGTTSGTRFVTLDELRTPSDLVRLTRAYESVLDLARSGLTFVVAPEPAVDGSPVQLLDDRFVVTVRGFVEAEPWPAAPSREDSLAVAVILARLHAASPPHGIGRDDFRIDARNDLESALDRPLDPVDGGPYAASTRRLLDQAAAQVRQRLDRYDRTVEAVQRLGAELVTTHGEPKPGNLLRTEAGPRLIDWDTVLLAPPERDLWWFADEPDLLEAVAEASGRPVEQHALELYRQRWDLTDLALYVRDLLRPHADDADSAIEWERLREILG